MTTITLPRATVEQALEALTPWMDSDHTVQHAAYHALRAALAQQAERVEPVAWMYTGIKQDGTEHGPHLVWKPEYMDAMSASKGAKATPLYTAPPQQAEPVATQHRLVIESRDGDLYMNDRQIDPGSIELRADGCTYRSAVKVDVRPQPAETVALKHRHEWFRTGGMEPGQMRCIHCGVWGQEQADPKIADHLARHGIQACLYPNCVGGQSGTVCHKHCPTTCPDCRGLGYDASGQLCRCQQNPSF